MKQCTICKKRKPILEFRMRPTGIRGVHCSNCRKQIRHNRRKLWKKKVLQEYCIGKLKCACCSEEELDFLSLDHIGGKKTRILLGHMGNSIKGLRSGALYARLATEKFPHKDKLRVLCMNCNMATAHNRICPHKRKYNVKK